MTAGAHRVAVDLGGTKIRAARVTTQGTPGTPTDVATPTDDLPALLDAVAGVVERCRAVDDREGSELVIGLGIPGVVDRTDGRLTRCQNIPAADGIDIVHRLATHLQAEVRVDNDVNLAALGELHHGAGGGTEELVVLSLGTGVGAGIVSGGRLLRGARGLAAEVADLPLFGDPRDPGTRAQGSLEQAIGSAGIVRDYHQRGGSGRHTCVAELVEAREQDGHAAAALTTLADRVAVTVLALQAVVDPAVVVLTGGIGASPAVAPRLQAATAALVGAVPQVLVSSLGADAGLYGAAVLARGAAEPWVRIDPGTSRTAG